MKTLVVYYSLTRNNELLAKAIRKRLNCDIYRISEASQNGFSMLVDTLLKREPRIEESPYTISNYDQIIFVAPVWDGDLPGPVKAFLKRERNHIQHYSFITLCTGVEGQRDKIVATLTQLVGREPVRATELWIKDLLPEEEHSFIETTDYRIRKRDLARFSDEIESFLHPHEAARRRLVPEPA